MLTIPARRGFSLLEVMIALVCTLVVIGAVHRLLVTTQRLTRAQAEQAEVQTAIRSGSLAVVNELRELSTRTGGSLDQNDILQRSPAGITYRASRGLGFICQTPVPGRIRIARNSFSGFRDPQPGRDMAYVFVEAGPDAGSEESWLPLNIAAVTTSGTCSAGGGSGITLVIPDAGAIPGLDIGTPVRIAEVVELRLYESEGNHWLGSRSVSSGEAIQPLVGPLAEGNGFALEYFDGQGSPTADLTSIKSIRVTLRGPPGKIGEEKLVTQVSLRNGLFP